MVGYNKNMNPLVSIIIPVYNGADYLADAINSALNQTYQNIEVIVVNDGSNDSDATEKIALSYSDKINYIKKENGGVSTALNMGIQNMKGEYFSWLSHDDMYTSNKIQSQIDFLKSNNKKEAICFSDFELLFVDTNQRGVIKMPSVNDTDFLLWIATDNKLHGCTLLIPKIFFDKFGIFNENLLATQDYDLWFRFAESIPFLYQSENFVISRQHSQQTTYKISKRVILEGNFLRINFFKKLVEKNIVIEAPFKFAFNFTRNRKFLASYYMFKYYESRFKFYNIKYFTFKIGKYLSFILLLTLNNFLLKELKTLDFQKDAN
jgi:glycosyltransferase involved in cell wall biosynthesis